MAKLDFIYLHNLIKLFIFFYFVRFVIKSKHYFHLTYSHMYQPVQVRIIIIIQLL